MRVEDIEKFISDKGGYSKAALQSLGVSWPPQKGWKKALMEGRPMPTKKQKRAVKYGQQLGAIAQGRVITRCWQDVSGRVDNCIKMEEKIIFIFDHYKPFINPNWTKSERREAAAEVAIAAGYKTITKKQDRAKTHTQKEPVKAAKGFGRKVTKLKSDQFYASWEWKKARYEALKIHGRQCMCCGWTPSAGSSGHLCVDHIKPRSKHPSLALDVGNLQILCNSCNMGKSNVHEDDFRSEWHGDEEEADDPLTAQFRDMMQ